MTRSISNAAGRRLFLWVPALAIGALLAGAAPLTSGEREAKKPGGAVQRARDRVELLQAKLEVHKAITEEAAVRLEAARKYVGLIEPAAKVAALSTKSLVEARTEVEVLRAQVRIKQAKQRVAEVRLEQARRRLARLEEGGPKGKSGPGCCCGTR